MKRTKSMNYKESTGSRELFLYAINDGYLYSQVISPIINNLRKKTVKGIYDNEKTVDTYYMAACESSKMYNKEFRGSFSVTDRFTCAVDTEAYYRDDAVFYNLSN